MTSESLFLPKNVFWKNFSFMISLESIVIYSLEWNYNFLNKYYGLKYDIVEIYFVILFRYFGIVLRSFSQADRKLVF